MDLEELRQAQQELLNALEVPVDKISDEGRAKFEEIKSRISRLTQSIGEREIANGAAVTDAVQDIARIHGQSIEKVVGWMAYVRDEMTRLGPGGMARMIFEGLEAEGRLTDVDREHFKEILGSQEAPPGT